MLCSFLPRATGFVIDLLSVLTMIIDILPLTVLRARTDGDTAALESVESLRIVRMLRTLRLVKLVRLLKTSRLIKRWQAGARPPIERSACASRTRSRAAFAPRIAQRCRCSSPRRR